MDESELHNSPLATMEEWVFRLLRIRSTVIQERARQFFRFAVAGSIGACIDLSTLPLIVEFTPVPKEIAFAISSTLSVTFVFFFNKFITFRRRQIKGTGKQLIKFVVVYGCAIALNAAISSGFLWLGFHYFVAKVLAIGIGMILNFILSRTFIFAV